MGPLKIENQQMGDTSHVFKAVGRLQYEKRREERLRMTPHCNKYYADPLKFRSKPYPDGIKFKLAKKDLTSLRSKGSNIADINKEYLDGKLKNPEFLR